MNRGLPTRSVALVMALGLAAGLAGCARDLARASSSAIGCAPEAIEVDDISVGWSQLSWSAECRGHTFRCSGEEAATCAPALDADLDAPAVAEVEAPPTDAPTK